MSEKNPDGWELIDKKVMEKIDHIEKNMKKVLESQEKILNCINIILKDHYSYLTENRKIYTELLNNCYNMQKETKKILQENRVLYLDNIQKVYDKEVKNTKILTSLKNDQKYVTPEISGINDLRVDNILWREYSHKNTQASMKNFLSGMLFR